MSKIHMYSTQNCPYCVKAKTLLKNIGESFSEYRVDADENTMAEMIEKSGGMRSVPQIFINGEHIGGCDELYALHESGKLKGMLG